MNEFNRIKQRVNEKFIQEKDIQKRGYYMGVLEIIEEVEKDFHNGWIPIEEQLPKTKEYLLLSFSNSTKPDIGRYEENENGDGNFYFGDEEETCLSQDFFVNAWQPLPEIYQTKKQREMQQCANLGEILQIVINHIEQEPGETSFINVMKLIEILKETYC